MSIESRLRSLVTHVCDLLGCSNVFLFLECSVTCLRHPLLLHLPSCFPRFVNYATTDDERFLHAILPSSLCDIALQTGIPWRVNTFVFPSAASPGSIMVAPLERFSGILGFLVFVSPLPDGFLEGECRLLEQYLPIVALQVENALTEVLATPSPAPDVVTDMHEQNEFIAFICHELRVPLTAIKGYAGLLHAYGCADAQDEFPVQQMTAGRQQQYLTSILEQTYHLEVLIADLLDVSRIQAGRLALRPTWIDIAQLCQRGVRMMQDRFDRQSPDYYHFCLTIDSHLPPVWADPHRVQQIFFNLLENAVKYSPDGGEIAVHVCMDSSYPDFSSLSSKYKMENRMIFEQLEKMNTTSVEDPTQPPICVIVRDYGIGIPHHQQSALFQPFTRLEHASTQRIGGAGLGLYISRKLVEAMGGQIMLFSDEGEGTVVTFTLPSSFVDKKSVSYTETQSIRSADVSSAYRIR